MIHTRVRRQPTMFGDRHLSMGSHKEPGSRSGIGACFRSLIGMDIYHPPRQHCPPGSRSRRNARSTCLPPDGPGTTAAVTHAARPGGGRGHRAGRARCPRARARYPPLVGRVTRVVAGGYPPGATRADRAGAPGRAGAATARGCPQAPGRLPARGSRACAWGMRPGSRARLAGLHGAARR
jgi:hypothetical protein